jgi:hypothetical protein
VPSCQFVTQLEKEVDFFSHSAQYRSAAGRTRGAGRPAAATQASLVAGMNWNSEESRTEIWDFRWATARPPGSSRLTETPSHGRKQEPAGNKFRLLRRRHSLRASPLFQGPDDPARGTRQAIAPPPCRKRCGGCAGGTTGGPGRGRRPTGDSR